jgi:hypothetical protein
MRDKRHCQARNRPWGGLVRRGMARDEPEYSVAIVVDRTFGDRTDQLARRLRVWIVDSL